MELITVTNAVDVQIVDTVSVTVATTDKNG
jgi:hypothetical protein